ncbi:transposase [Patescibacteria group bacterium]
MARPLRIELPSALYHVTARGNARKPIFLSDHDRYQFLHVLAQIVKSHNWLIHAYCLMNNHYHLLIETPDGNLSRCMRDLNGIYSQRFNRIHNKVGHLFQGRFKSFLIEKEPYLLSVARYIILNPVRAGISEFPGDWKWSSYRATAGHCRPHAALTTDWILGCFDGKKKQAQQAYIAFVKDGMWTDNPLSDVVEGNILGYPQYVHHVWSIKPNTDELKEVPRNERMVGRPKLEDLFIDLKNKKERNKMIEFAYFRCGYTQKNISDTLNLHYSTVSKIINNSRFKT